MVVCLEDFDPGVKEAAAWALGYVARHNKSLAQATVDAGNRDQQKERDKDSYNVLYIRCGSADRTLPPRA